VLGGQSPAVFSVSYHQTQGDATTGSNPLPDQFANTANPQVVYVRIENGFHPECFDTTNFLLHVMALPNVNFQDSYSICEGHPITITAPFGFDGYEWSDGSTANGITVSTGGNYSLTVYRDYGDITCSNTENFVVHESGLATITSVDIRDWT